MIPDFQKQKLLFSETISKLDNYLKSCDATFDNVSDMKKGEGFYFKSLYETMKLQMDSFNQLADALVGKKQKPSEAQLLQEKKKDQQALETWKKSQPNLDQYRVKI